MSTIAYSWNDGAPPTRSVYRTRKNGSKYLTLRYWDGQRWWQIDLTGGRTSKAPAFVWPKGSRVAMPKGWAVFKPTMTLRRINDQTGIEWGTPYRVYDEKEVLAHLLKTGRLIKHWQHAYQAEMRASDQRPIRD